MSLLSPGFLLVCLFCFALLFSHPCPVYQEILLGIPSKYIQANLTLFNYSHCQPFPFPVANLRLLSDYYNILFTVLPCFILIPSVYFKPSRKTELVRCKSQTTSTPSSPIPLERILTGGSEAKCSCPMTFLLPLWLSLLIPLLPHWGPGCCSNTMAGTHLPQSLSSCPSLYQEDPLLTYTPRWCYFLPVFAQWSPSQ